MATQKSKYKQITSTVNFVLESLFMQLDHANVTIDTMNIDGFMIYYDLFKSSY